jgi:hypothetical protein
VKCPKGRSVVGGGIYMSGSNSEIFVSATRPWDSFDDDERADDGWFVRAANIAGGKKVMTAHAMCRADVSSKPFGGFGGAGPGAGGVGAGCNPGNDSLTGVGGEIGGDPTAVRLSAVMPFDNDIEDGTVPDDSVVAQAENLTAETVPFGAFGVCLR